MPAPDSFQEWIEDGEKFALVAINVKLEDPLPFCRCGADLWAIGDVPFQLPTHWREWLGTIRAEEVDGSNLLLLSKCQSRRPDVLDDENQMLDRAAWHFYVGLLLSSRFAAAHKPVMLSGARIGEEISVRQQKDFDCPVPCEYRYYPAVTADEIRLAGRRATNIATLVREDLPGGQWRFFRALTIYTRARVLDDIVERIHQYCRCIEGVILPATGNTGRQFKSRTELFIGPKHHDLIGDIYEVRSAVEHLHESRYLEVFDREVRLGLIEKEAVIESLARRVLGRIIDTPALWPQFANAAGLQAFWAKPADEQRALWGAPFDAREPLQDFDPRFIPDGHLGK